MKLTKFLLSLCMCVSLICSCFPSVLAAEPSSTLTEFITRYDTLFDTVLDTFQDSASGGLQITDELRQQLSECDPAALLSDLNALSKDTAALTDEELENLIAAAAEKHGVPLVEKQIHQLRDLLRLLEKLSEDELREKLDSLKDGAEKLRGNWEKLSGILNSVQHILEKITSVVQPTVQRISQLFETVRSKI